MDHEGYPNPTEKYGIPHRDSVGIPEGFRGIKKCMTTHRSEADPIALAIHQPRTSEHIKKCMTTHRSMADPIALAIHQPRTSEHMNPCQRLSFLKKIGILKKPMKAIGPRRIPEPNRKIWDSTQGFRGDSGGIPRDSVWVCRDSMGFRVGRNYEFSHIWGVRNFPYYNIRSENARNTWVRVPVSGPFILCLQGSVSAPCIYCSRILLQNPGVCACAPRF